MTDNPQVQSYMTYIPYTVGEDRPLKVAIDLMRKLQVRHLPVLKGSKLVGILSERDITLVLGFNDDPEKVLVEEAYTPDPYTTRPDANLVDVAREMARHKYGSALVVDNGKLIGIFTETDAYRALAEALA